MTSATAARCAALFWTLLTRTSCATPTVCARVTLGQGVDGVTMWFGEGLEWVQLFSGDPLNAPYRRSALAVEPMSCPPNAFATGKGVIALAPGASVTHTWGIVRRGGW